MVSIPDWNKITRSQEALKNKNSNSLERYHRQRDEEIIRQAEKLGYIVVPSKEFILENTKTDKKIKDLSSLQFVKLTSLHLRKPGEISLCTNITICILSNNFLTKIDGLANCQQLIKLDLHSNELAHLPGEVFWSRLSKLRSLHLHDNPLGRFDILHNLSACSTLSILTLYDTPLFLKKNYRHHVVNSIWSLKALDYHVISDEEIIEDASFSPRFSAMAPQFRLNLCPQLKKNSSFKDELEVLFITEAKMNFLLSHFSPVLIIQRYIRGYLTRFRLGFQSEFHCLRHVTPQTSNQPRITGRAQPSVPHATSTHESMPHFTSMIKLPQPEFDSQACDTGTTTTQEGTKGSGNVPMNSQRSDELDYLPLVKCLPSDNEVTEDLIPRQRKNIFINLAKLHQETGQLLQDEISAIQAQHRAELHERMMSRTPRSQPSQKEEEKPKRIKNVKQFFGPVVESCPSPDTPYEILPEIVDELPITRYRICGFKPRIAMIDATTEMVLSRKEAGNLVRDAEAEHHRKLTETPLPKQLPKKLPNTDQRIFNRLHGNMGMSCLFAVQNAYKEREKAEKTAEKMEHILNLRDEKMRAKERIQLYRAEKRNSVLNNRNKERVRLQETIEKRELNRLNYLDNRQDRMSRTAEVAKSLKNEMKFAQDFTNQHTSVSNALMRHDRQARQDDISMKNFDVVQNLRQDEQEQQETVKKYMEHRQLMRQGESAMKKDLFNSQLLQEANDRLFQSQQRVAQLKAKRDSIQAFYPLPPRNVPNGLKTAPAGLSRFEATVMSSAGRMGRHPTMVT